MKKTIFSIVTIFALAIGLSFAYADEFRITFDPDFLVDHSLSVIMTPTDDGGADLKVTHTSWYHFSNILEVPENIRAVIIDDEEQIIGSSVVILGEIAEDVMEPEPEPTEAEKLGISEDTFKRLEEKRAELEVLAEEALTCVLGIEGSSIFTEYRELQVLKKMIIWKNLPSNYKEVQLIRWTEECRVWNESYLSYYPEYYDKYIAQRDNPAYSKILDETDSAFTDPLTEQDFLDEIEDAERFMCSIAGKQRGICVKEFEGINRGGYTEGAECLTQMGRVMCPLIDYNKLITTALSAEQNYDVIKELVCEKYLDQYSALVNRIKAGDKTAQLPNWLAHCEIE